MVHVQKQNLRLQKYKKKLCLYQKARSLAHGIYYFLIFLVAHNVTFFLWLKDATTHVTLTVWLGKKYDRKQKKATKSKQ